MSGNTKEERKKFKHSKIFVPGGQSTQLIVGATSESDYKILNLTSNLYDKYKLKRVYYSAYVGINEDKALPSPANGTPLLREHRLYQADWLLRFYHFAADEILSEAIILPLCPDKGSCMSYDVNLAPSVYLENDLEQLMRQYQ